MYDEAVDAGKSRLEAYTLCGLPGVQGDKTALEAKLAVWGWFWDRLRIESEQEEPDLEVWKCIYEIEKEKSCRVPRKKAKGKKR